MAVVIKRTKYPKMANGGMLDTSFLGNQEGINFQDFAASMGNQGTQGSEKTANAIATGVQAIPVWGQIVGAGMKIGQGIGKQTTDEFGIYKNKGSEIVDNIFNPTTHIQNIKDNFKNPTASGITNMLTLGAFGKSANQRRLEHLRDVFRYDQSMSKVAQNERMGAKIHNSLPSYQAPRYGKEGMKLAPRYKTKFSQDGKN